MNKKNRNLLIFGLIALAIYFAFWLIPAGGTISPIGYRMIGLLVAYYFAIITIGDIGTLSLCAFLLFGFSGYTQVIPAAISAGGSVPMNMTLAVCAFGAVMQLTGLAKILAEKIISAKITNGRPWMLTLFIMLAAAIPAALITTAIPVAIILWSILKNIFEITGFQKGDKWPAIMMCVAAFLSLFAASTMPYNGGVLNNFGLFQTMNPDAPYFNAGGYAIAAIVIDILVIVLLWLMIRFVLRPDVSKLKNYKAPEKHKLDTKQRIGAWLLILFIFICLVPSFLPNGGFKDFLGNFGVIGAGYLCVIIACFCRDKEGKSYVNFMDVAKNIPWQIIFMIATLMAIAASFSDPELGIGQALTNVIAPIATKIGPFGLFALLVIVAIVLTNLLDNSLVSVLIMTVVGPACGALGISATAYAPILERSCEYAIFLPAASPNAAMLYGEVDSGWLKRKDIMKTAIGFIICFVIVMIPIGYLMSPLIG